MLAKTISLIGIAASACMLFMGLVNEKAVVMLLPASILGGASLIALALTEKKQS